MTFIRDRLILIVACAAMADLFSARIAVAQPADPGRLDSTARLLAGLPPTHPEHAHFAEQGKWIEHGKAMQASWARVQKLQMTPLLAWRAKEITPGCPVGSTLLYPFSGPDFLNAYWLFPGCSRMVFFGLEAPGRVPNIEAMAAGDFARLLERARGAMTNLFVRNYFITSSMAKDLHTAQLQGVVPVIMISMALAGVEVTRVAPIDTSALQLLGPDGVPPRKSLRPRIRGVTIEFRVPNSAQARRLDYYALDATNVGLSNYPGFLDRLRGLGTTTTLIKSASYLLHSGEFTRIRDVILDASGYILQDDTGMPYARLVKRGWEVRVFGRYEVPIPPFEGAFQASLAAAYERAKPEPLSFRFGYTRRTGENRSNLMIAQPRARQQGAVPPLRPNAEPRRG